MTKPPQVESDPHPYRGGYSVLPQLRKIARAEVFQFDKELHQRCLREKASAAQSQIVHVEHNLSSELREAVRDFFIQNHPLALDSEATLESIAMQIQEDLILHAVEQDRDWMAYGHVSLPSSWRPEEKIGLPLEELHAPIPGMRLENSRQLVETMVHHGPFERFIWSVVFADRLNFHPDQPVATFDPAHPLVFVKLERQVTLGFPEQRGALFLLRQSLLTPDQFDHTALAETILRMSPAELKYKGLFACRNELLLWLRSTS